VVPSRTAQRRSPVSRRARGGRDWDGFLASAVALHEREVNLDDWDAPRCRAHPWADVTP